MGVEKLPCIILCHTRKLKLYETNNLKEKIMNIQSSGAFLDNFIFTLSIISFTFMCASVFGRSWEHGSGILPEFQCNITKNHLEILQDVPKNPTDVYFGPFDECGQQSSHVNACGKMYTCRFFLVTTLIILICSYTFERFEFVKKQMGEKKAAHYSRCSMDHSFIVHVNCFIVIFNFYNKG